MFRNTHSAVLGLGGLEEAVQTVAQAHKLVPQRLDLTQPEAQ
jgi:hypothetical protein